MQKKFLHQGRLLPKGGEQHGFTLLEILIAILVTGVGLLGFVKMQALAIASTQVASVRSLVAMQASSLAAAMQGNRTYWAAGLAPANFGAVGATVSDSTGVLNASVSTCEASATPSTGKCTAVQLAAFDVQAWAASMYQQLPSYAANVVCTTNVASPITCLISVTWTEKYVTVNAGSATSSSATGSSRSYSLYVEP